ncbi:hypothetical protein ACFW93_20990 [Streptomyces canus]|uniref:hypothetical protein n=1 Tax=Streptomyces canus TaxID=58343 RepID=UPI0036A2B8A2
MTTADVHDSKAAPALLETFMDQPGPLLKLVWVDSACQGPALAKAFARHGVRIEVVRALPPTAALVDLRGALCFHGVDARRLGEVLRISTISRLGTDVRIGASAPPSRSPRPPPDRSPCRAGSWRSPRRT